MITLFDDPPFLQYNNSVTATDRRQAVGDDNGAALSNGFA